MGKSNKEFCLSEEGQREVELKLRSLLETCQTYHTPMFAAVAIANTETGTEYNRVVYGAGSHAVELSDDQIRRHILIADGFHAVPEREDMTIDMSEIL